MLTRRGPAQCAIKWPSRIMGEKYLELQEQEELDNAVFAPNAWCTPGGDGNVDGLVAFGRAMSRLPIRSELSSASLPELFFLVDAEDQAPAVGRVSVIPKGSGAEGGLVAAHLLPGPMRCLQERPRIPAPRLPIGEVRGHSGGGSG